MRYAATLNLERRFPKRGENPNIRWQLMGRLGETFVQVPFETVEDAKQFAKERNWRILDGLTVRATR